MPRAPASPLIGIAMLVLSSWALSGLDTSAKWIMAAGAPILLLGWVRFTVHLLLVLMLVRPKSIKGILRTQRPYSQLLRGVVMLGATFSFFTALSYLPQAEATSMIFLAPLLVLATAPWILKEPAHLSRWLAALGGFIGILVIIRPGSGLNPVGTGFALLTAFLFATQYICTRRVAVDNPMTTLVWSGGVGAVCLTLGLPYILIEAYPFIRDFGPQEWLILLGTGFWGALGHLLQIQAYRQAPASLLAPFVYLQIIAAATLGWLVWGHFPDAITWLGIAIVCASGIIIGLIEWRRSAAPPVDTAA